MKKIFGIVLIVLLSFTLAGCEFPTTTPNADVNEQVYAIYLLASDTGAIEEGMTYEEWLESVVGPEGQSIELQVSEGYIQWKYPTTETWDNLLPLTDLIGPNGLDGKEVTFQVTDTFIQWQYLGDETWQDLISLEVLMGLDGTNGKEVTFQVADSFIQWQYSGDTSWVNLIDLASLTGTPGTDGLNAKEVTFQVADGFIQWQYLGETTWSNLVELSTLVGLQGDAGTDGKEVEFIVEADSFMWRYVGDTLWTQLFALEDIIGAPGDDGQEVTFQVAEGYIQWQYKGELNWTNLIEIATLIGPAGENGADGKSAYELYLEKFPEYTRTEAEWLDDLVNGLLGEKNQVEVTFDPNNNEDSFIYTIDEYTKVPKPDNPIKEGYNFQSWTYGDVEWVFFGYVVSEDMTLDAYYVPLEYSIDYILGDDNAENGNDSSYNIESETFSIEEPILEGYLFTGWTYEGQESPTKEVTIIKGSMGDLELTAHWIELTPELYNNQGYSGDETSELVDIFYYLSFEDGYFLLIETHVYSNDEYEFHSFVGTLENLGSNINELVFDDETHVPMYILMNDEGVYFCDEFGNLLVEPDTGNLGRDEFAGSNLDLSKYGFGYFDLSYTSNADARKDFYEKLLEVNSAFAESTENFSNIDNSNLFIDVDLSEYGLTAIEGIETTKIFLLDHPEYFWMSNTITILGNQLQIELVEEYKLYENRELVQIGVDTMITELEQLMNEDMNELEMAKVIHDYIILRVDYSYEEDGTTPEDDYWAHNIDGIATLKGAVCESYAETFKLLADHFGLYSISVTGSSNNNERHQWNILRIDDVYYHLDLTWDDAGEENVSYTYFGLSYTSIQNTHNIDQPTDTSIEYLYQLPTISEEDITFVTLFENDVELGLYVSIESAFNDMTDSTLDYELTFFDYDRVGPLLMSSSVREYTIPAGEFPTVNSLTFNGTHYDAGGGYFTSTQLHLAGDVQLNSNITLSDIRLYTVGYSLEAVVDLRDYSLLFTGYHNQTSGSIDIVGTLNSKVITNVEYEVESYSQYNIGDLILNHGPLLVRGEVNTFNNVFNNDLNGYMRVFGGVIEVNITNLYINAEHVAMIKLDNVYGTIINIENSTAQYTGNTYRINVRVNGIENMPTINLTGNIDHRINYSFSSDMTFVSTTIGGEEVGRWVTSTNIADHGELPIITAQNMTMDQIDVKYGNAGYITELYVMDEFGNVYRDKSFIEVIEDGVLVKVISLSEGFENSYTIPEGVTTIATSALESYIYLTELIIPDSVTTFEQYALGGLDFLETVYIPTSVVNVAEYGLNSNATILIAHPEPLEGWINYPDSKFSSVVYGVLEVVDNGEFVYAVTSFDTISILSLSSANDNTDIIVPNHINGMPVTQIVRNAFNGNGSITSIVLPNTLIDLVAGSFQNCHSLRSVVFEENSQLEFIGYYVFFSLDLTEIHIPDSVQFIDYRAFSDNPGIQIYVASQEQVDLWDEDWNLNQADNTYLPYIIETQE